MEKCEQINLHGYVDYNTKYPPIDARKGYVARIMGREPGPKRYERHFMGETANLLEGDEGLYERQRGNKKGGYTRWYDVILSHTEYGLIESCDCEEDAPKIAKLLGEGLAIEDIVVPDESSLRPHKSDSDRMVFERWTIRTKSQAKSSAKSASVQSATDACWDVLQLLPEKEAKKVLTAIRKRLKPGILTTEPNQ